MTKVNEEKTFEVLRELPIYSWNIDKLPVALPIDVAIDIFINNNRAIATGLNINKNLQYLEIQAKMTSANKCILLLISNTVDYLEELVGIQQHFQGDYPYSNKQRFEEIVVE